MSRSFVGSSSTEEIRRPREEPREQQPVALAAGERPNGRVGPLRRKQEIAEIGQHVLAPAGGLHPFGARADRFGERAFAVELLRATGRSTRSGASCPRRTVPESGGSVPRISFSSVDLPAPLGPIKPSRSPRMMRSVRSRTSMRPPNALVTCESSATSRPERSPASIASFTLPSRARRSLRSRRSDSSLSHAPLVARAARLDALADPALPPAPRTGRTCAAPSLRRRARSPCAPRTRRSCRDTSAGGRDRARRCAWPRDRGTRGRA